MTLNETSMKLSLLLDTNVVIALEPYAGVLEKDQQVAAECVRIAQQHGHHVVVHPANKADLEQTSDAQHRKQNLAALDKYVMLQESPIALDLYGLFNGPDPESNDYRDLRLLSALKAGSATQLLTNDDRLRRRAQRAGLGDRVLTPAAMLEFLHQLHPLDPSPPPSVRQIAAAALDLSQPIFDSLRADYADFDNWVRRIASDQARRTWIVSDEDGSYRAIAIVKPNDDHPLLPATKSTKLCTFKVDERAQGEKLGELLLKTVFNWCREQNLQRIFVTVRDDATKDHLKGYLREFGFESIGALPDANAESVLEKVFSPGTDEELTPLQYHIKYGPKAIMDGAEVLVVPIIPRWYDGLFPDAPYVGRHGQVSLGDIVIHTSPFGNALRKAYLSSSKLAAVKEGSTLLFYRSGGGRGPGGIEAVGVAERSLRSSDPAKIMSFVGTRTVYSADEVVAMCQDDRGNAKEVLAILFRQDRFLDRTLTLEQLVEGGVLSAAPQSIVKVKRRSRGWIYERLNA